MNETTTENGGQPLELPKQLDPEQALLATLEAVRQYANCEIQKSDLAARIAAIQQAAKEY